MGVGSSDEIGHDRERDENWSKVKGAVLPCNRYSILVWRYKSSECPCGAPDEPAENIRG